MRVSRCLAGGLACLCAVTTAPAEAPRPPLRLVHEGADLLLEVPNPRRLVEAATRLDLLQQLKAFPDFRALLDSTPARRAAQLVAYLERELGAPWPELLDRLAGEGAVAASTFGPQPAPALLVLQGRDEKLAARFFRVGLDVLDQELARREGKERVARGEYHGLPVAHAGKGFHAAQAGPALLVSNNEQALRAGLDRHLGREKKSLADSGLVRDSHRLLPGGPLARLWVNLDAAHKSPEGKALFRAPRDDANLTAAVGAYLDLVGRSPYACAGLYPEDRGFLLSARLPRGRDGMGADQILHLPPAGAAGSRPLLEPPGVLYSESSYFDFARVWSDRAQLFPEQQVKKFEEFDRTSARFLVGNRLSKLLSQVGPYYRFVAVNQPKVGYKTTPDQVIPAFALVSELREPEEFGKSIGTVLRAAALLAGANPNIKWELTEEKYQGCDLVAYRFREDQPAKDDPGNFRFNFSPSFTRVGNQFVYCSTQELCRELVDLLHKESREKPAGADSTSRIRLYGAGAAELLNVFRDRLVVETILDQAVKPGEAREQVDRLVALVRGLGTLELGPHVADKEFRYDVRLRVGE
jgi:hypothetical protein